MSLTHIYLLSSLFCRPRLTILFVFLFFLARPVGKLNSLLPAQLVRKLISFLLCPLEKSSLIYRPGRVRQTSIITCWKPSYQTLQIKLRLALAEGSGFLPQLQKRRDTGKNQSRFCLQCGVWLLSLDLKKSFETRYASLICMVY